MVQIDNMTLQNFGPSSPRVGGSDNPWWLDVLENGAASRFAHFFDIEWHPVKDELADKVLIPILGDQYGAVLERQELQLAYRDGAFRVQYYDDVLPIARSGAVARVSTPVRARARRFSSARTGRSKQAAT